MGKYLYKGYEINIEQAVDIEGFYGGIKKDGIYYGITKPVEKVKNRAWEQKGSIFNNHTEMVEWETRLYDETLQKLKKELETIVDGIEVFLQVEREKIEKEKAQYFNAIPIFNFHD